jgi:hypothetical protein
VLLKEQIKEMREFLEFCLYNSDKQIHIESLIENCLAKINKEN